MNRKTLSLADWQQQQQSDTPRSAPVTSTSENLIYSTDGGDLTQPKPAKAGGEAYADGKVRLQRQTKKRGGKAVIVVRGIAKPHDELTLICKALKQSCACGGTVKDGTIELQNDQRERVEEALKKLGYSTLWAGG